MIYPVRLTAAFLAFILPRTGHSIMMADLPLTFVLTPSARPPCFTESVC